MKKAPIPEKNIVLIHGWGASTAKLNPLEKELSRLGWNTLNLKLPGFDLPDPESAWGLDEYANYLDEKAENKFRGKKYLLFGHSFGGSISIFQAASNPKCLKGLILCAPGGITRRHAVKRYLFMLFAKVGKAIFSLIPGGLLFRRLLYKLAREQDYHQARPIMRQVLQKAISTDKVTALKEIKVPSLILWGKKDRTTPVIGAALIKIYLNNVTVNLYENQGHQLPYQLPKKLAVAINKWNFKL